VNVAEELTRRGLYSNERAAVAYQNLSTAFSIGVLDVIDAIDDAAIGETERAKVLGFRFVRVIGGWSITFQGREVLVSRSPAAVQDYFIRAGEMIGGVS
jgi:hypothetical protein